MGAVKGWILGFWLMDRMRGMPVVDAEECLFVKIQVRDRLGLEMLAACAM